MNSADSCGGINASGDGVLDAIDGDTAGTLVKVGEFGVPETSRGPTCGQVLLPDGEDDRLGSVVDDDSCRHVGDFAILINSNGGIVVGSGCEASKAKQSSEQHS
ncbi:hypothetical protein HYQ46_004922 [Verticillium longisporum]|nr:hypothetical protein HYQ46_004922 [Verticillium longisporum]